MNVARIAWITIHLHWREPDPCFQQTVDLVEQLFHCYLRRNYEIVGFREETIRDKETSTDDTGQMNQVVRGYFKSCGIVDHCRGAAVSEYSGSVRLRSDGLHLRQDPSALAGLELCISKVPVGSLDCIQLNGIDVNQHEDETPDYYENHKNRCSFRLATHFACL